MVQRDLQPGTLDRSARATHWLTFLGIGVSICLLIAGVLAALSARQDAWQLAEQQAKNLRLTLARDIERNVSIFDLSLRGVIEALGAPGIEAASQEVRRHALFDRAAGAEDLGSIVVAASNGIVSATSNPRLKGMSIAGRPEFEVQRLPSAANPFVSRASQKSLDGDRPGIAISRKLTTREGRFSGVVSGVLNLSFFAKLFDRIDIGSRGSILLVRTDGHIIWRYPSRDSDVDRDLSASSGFQQMNSKPEGQFVAPSMVDGVIWLYSFRRVGSLPLIVSVNMAVDDIFARWRGKATIIGPTILLMCASIVAISILFQREMLRRTAAERALADAADTLTRIASIDVLTGVANRRSFETQFEREWSRALIEHTQISLLMIDADNFKRFNDWYGHLAGDRALKQIANVIAESLRRPADLAARFGGEEFVALLPECGARGARAVAERIVASIAQLAVPHEASEAKVMTVSVGVATMSPAEGDRAEDFLKEADDYLYEAKRDGRNVVRAADVDGLMQRYLKARRMQQAL